MDGNYLKNWTLSVKQRDSTSDTNQQSKAQYSCPCRRLQQPALRCPSESEFKRGSVHNARGEKHDHIARGVNAKIIEDHALPGKVSHFPKQSARLERNVEQS